MAETQAEGEAGSMQGAQGGTRSQVSRIMPQAEGGAKLLSHQGCPSTFKIAILKGMRWNIFVVLICISPNTGDVEHLFMHFLAICVSYLGKKKYSSLSSPGGSAV